MPIYNVDLTEHLDRFVEAGISSGRFSDASEVVREGLRLLEQREVENQARLDWLRAAAKDGLDVIDRGEYATLRSQREIPDFIHEMGEEASADLAGEERPRFARSAKGHPCDLGLERKGI
jgi:antitoxin ParD1/3/4